MKLAIPTALYEPPAIPSYQIRELLRDSASILRIRFHEAGASDHEADSARAEFISFMGDALDLIDPDAPVLSAEDAGKKRRFEALRGVRGSAWLLNPLDGVDAFRAGFPCFAVVLGLLERNSVVAGYVYNPVTEDLFWADEGRSGAFFRNRTIAIRRREGGLFGLHGRRGGSNRCSAALTLCSVAAGRSDFAAVYDCDWITSEVAGYIVRKAGGKMHTSRKHGTIASANRLLCRWAVQAGGKSG